MSDSVIRDVQTERQHQAETWLQDDYHSIGHWLVLLNIRLGKLADDMLRDGVTHPSKLYRRPHQLTESEAAGLYRRAIQTAAVASALAEQLRKRL